MRLIDADAMHKFVEDKVAEGKDGWANGVGYEWAWTLTAVDMQPTVDAIPVVRCKDCYYYKPGKDYLPYCDHADGGIADWPQEDDFCSYGKRR